MPNSLVDEVSQKLLAADRMLLEKTKLPIVTISASYRDLLEDQYRLDDEFDHQEVVFSRAHYSMALAAGIVAWDGDSPQPEKAWMVDPTNYVQHSDWKRVAMSETLGRLMARHSLLEWVKKNVLDTIGRQKFPLADEITPPLLHLFENVRQPVLSFHIVTGNILAQAGKTVVQVVTDPHVRPDYVQNAHLSNITFCVFDEQTRYEFFEVASAHGKKVDPERVIVTGPPIDPRVLAAAKHKRTDSWRRRPLRILLTTGGLGTNKRELESILKQLVPLTRRRQHNKVQLIYYAGTNLDHVAMVEKVVEKFHGVSISEDVSDKNAALRVISSEDIVDANNLLLAYGFPWADVVFTKPSGDMAYDAVGAGCAVLLLKPWGEWEVNIQAMFTQSGVARVVDSGDGKVEEQLEHIMDRSLEKPWLESALEKARLMPPEFYRGAREIVRTMK
ncbi:hypothetical protein LRY65_03565 [Candidatus Woesebacteria bacterium]|nr:hypothetical protein [Candidatus Woesebacteria bacterium]MCD8506970.1 hypothetical protein [Candidatus Woesebacteria bacterium]MCD8527261.1 hypothetical protein [Candidatus Woesebacteria bacterium]MCD8546628.1 hypothetical protein [Candidatus Woesebacteria bacterium]